MWGAVTGLFSAVGSIFGGSGKKSSAAKATYERQLAEQKRVILAMKAEKAKKSKITMFIMIGSVVAAVVTFFIIRRKK